MKLLLITATLLMTNVTSQSVNDFQEDQSIIFVYNADSGWFNGLTDYVHKIVSPDTYECNLCAITYGNLGMKKQWSSYLKSLPNPIKFIHKDEITDTTISSSQLPAIFLSNEKSIQLLASADETDNLNNLDELIDLMNDKLKVLN